MPIRNAKESESSAPPPDLLGATSVTFTEALLDILVVDMTQLIVNIRVLDAPEGAEGSVTFMLPLSGRELLAQPSFVPPP